MFINHSSSKSKVYANQGIVMHSKNLYKKGHSKRTVSDKRTKKKPTHGDNNTWLPTKPLMACSLALMIHTMDK